MLHEINSASCCQFMMMWSLQYYCPSPDNCDKMQCDPKKPPPLRFSDIFPKRLGIFSPNFTRLLGCYTCLSTLEYKFFIQLPPVVTKLCHIKCDHPACVSADGGRFDF